MPRTRLGAHRAFTLQTKLAASSLIIVYRIGDAITPFLARYLIPRQVRPYPRTAIASRAMILSVALFLGVTPLRHRAMPDNKCGLSRRKCKYLYI
jgi:hypothetical protein